MRHNIILHLGPGLAGSLFFSGFSTQNEIYEYFNSDTEDQLNFAAVRTKLAGKPSEQVHKKDTDSVFITEQTITKKTVIWPDESSKQ
jgi:hypothetical protein